MTRDRWLVLARKSAGQPRVLLGCLTVQQCSDCGVDCWSTTASQANAAAIGAKPICRECLLGRLRTSEVALFLSSLSEEQAKEVEGGLQLSPLPPERLN